MLKIGSAFLFLASSNANLLSPGLDKCLELVQGNPGINVVVTTCTDEKKQHFQIAKGSIESQLMQGMCLTADEQEANANVHLAACSPELAAKQKWVLTHYGNIKLGTSNLCLDIKAGLKADNTRENWNEIKQHEVNNVHLYTCHNPETTDRVNQLWTLAPFKNGLQVTARTGPVTAVAPVVTVPIAAPAVTASMPENVNAALAIQGVVGQYKDDKEASLSTQSFGLTAWGFGCAAVTSSFIVLYGLYRWNSHKFVAVKYEEADAMGAEINDF